MDPLRFRIDFLIVSHFDPLAKESDNSDEYEKKTCVVVCLLRKQNQRKNANSRAARARAKREENIVVLFVLALGFGLGFAVLGQKTDNCKNKL